MRAWSWQATSAAVPGGLEGDECEGFPARAHAALELCERHLAALRSQLAQVGFTELLTILELHPDLTSRGAWQLQGALSELTGGIAQTAE